MADDPSQFAHHPPNPAGDEPAPPVPNPTSYTVHRAGPGGGMVGKAKNLKAASRMVDRLDLKHGADVHFYRRAT